MPQSIRSLFAWCPKTGVYHNSSVSLTPLVRRRARSTMPYRVGWLLLICLLIIGKATAQVWTAQVSGTSQSLYSVWSRDASTLWTVGNNGTILSTLNGGATWTAQVSGTSALLTSVWGSDASTVWAVGDGGTILKTTNGGST